MIPRVTFLSIAAFWVAMNVLLWRAEYGSRGSGIPVPVDLVWRKILTAPDASSLTVYQDGQKTGFCEFSTSVEQAMAALDEDKPPPEGIVARAGYQIRFDGNVSLGEFTNRLNFDGRIQFSSAPRLARIESEIVLARRRGGNSFRRHQPDRSFENHRRRRGHRTGFHLCRFAKSQHVAARVRRRFRRRAVGRIWICPPFRKRRPRWPAVSAGKRITTG